MKNNKSEIKTYKIKYDLILAYKSGINEHPIKQMKALGYNIVKMEACPIFDCLMFDVECVFEPMPNYLKLMT